MTLLSINAAAQITIVPTTTIGDETKNNTSASSTFKTQTDGNAAAGNVSKLPIRNLLYSGSTTKIFAAVMPWFGRTDHMDVGYNSSDPTQIRAQVNDMQSRGIQGAIIPWYGPNSNVESAMAINFVTEANTRGGSFEVAMMIDVGALVAYAKQNGCDVTQQLIDHLNYIANTFYGAPAYARIDGRPVVYFFEVDAYYINWSKVRTSVSGNPVFLKRNSGAFGATEADGAYSWIEINRSNQNDMMLTYLDTFYNAAAQNSTKYAVGSTYKGFNDTLAEWGSNRILSQQCARTWLATFAEIKKYYSSSHQLPALQLVTWNDYEEGSEMETGIDNCVSLSTRVTGSTLQWRIGDLATDNSIDHYTVFISKDGQNLMKLADVAAGTHSLDLAHYSLSAANYVLYVKAVGAPSITNHVSPPAGYNPANQSPIALLSVAPSSGPAPLTITASGAGSSDPDGSVTSATIDFGEGTVVSGISATHAYSKQGKYTVTLTVTDNAGVFAVAQKIVDVAAGPGVIITSPGSGATVKPTVHVVASGSMTNGVGYMEVLVDGVTPPAYVGVGSIVDTHIKIDAGTHQLRVVAHDKTNEANYIYSTITIYVSPTDVPPTAKLGVTPFGGTKVMACTSTSTDSDGYVSDSIVDFGDGTTGRGPTAFHTYANAGKYTVTAVVVDNAGLSGSTSTQVTVGTPNGSCPQPSTPGVNICSPLNGTSVSAAFTISAAGRNTNGTTGMDVWLDGKKLGWYDDATSIDVPATASAGPHQLDIYVIGFDGELKAARSSFAVTTCAIPSSPGVNICSPVGGGTYGSEVRILASGSDSVATAGMDVWIDGAKLAWYLGKQSVDITTNLSAGSHLLDIYAVGINGELQKGSVKFFVGACTMPSSPGVNICSPANNSIVGTSFHIYAAGRDNTTTAGMDVWLDGSKLGWYLSNTVDVEVNDVALGLHQLDIYAVGVNGELQKGSSLFTVK
jgi:PKD repeat protein